MKVESKLDDILWQKRMTLKDLERASGLHYKTLWDLANNKTTMIGFKTIVQICTALDITPGELLVLASNGGE